MSLSRFLIFVCCVLSTSSAREHHLLKRYLLFPRYTQMQFSTGLTVPLVLPRRSINLSLVAQANYFLPWNLTNFTPLTIAARDRTSFFYMGRRTVYKYIMEFLENFGLDGEQCLLRSICEVAETPLHIKDDETLLEKLAHFIFTCLLDMTKMIVEDLYISTPTFEIIQPLLITLRFFGLFPISYKKSGNNYRLKWSVIYGVYSYALSLVLVIWAMMGMIYDMQNDSVHSLRMTDDKTTFVTGGDISIVVIIVVFGTTTLHLKIKKFWKLMTILNQADNIIPFKNFKKFRKASITFLAIVIGTIILILSFDYSSWFTSLKKRGLHPLLYLQHYFAFYMQYSIIIMMEVFYLHVILLIKIRISLLNKDLLKIKEKAHFGSGNCFFERLAGNVYLDKISVFGPNWKNTGRNLSTATTHIKNDESVEIGKRLITLSIFHDKIFEAVAIVNNSMEFCIHVIMLSCLLHLIVTPYFLLKGIFGSGDSFYVTLQMIWLLGHIGRVLIIVEPCQQCINEHIKTSGIICELLTYEVNEELKKAMTILSLQLSYCKLRFSSCGFFKINRSLLTSIAGAVTTYLVILFQFNDTV